MGAGRGGGGVGAFLIQASAKAPSLIFDSKAINLDLSHALPGEWNKASRSLIKGEKVFEHRRIHVFMRGRPSVTKEFNQTTSLIKTTSPVLNDVAAVGALSFTFKKAGQSVHSS